MKPTPTDTPRTPRDAPHAPGDTLTQAATRARARLDRRDSAIAHAALVARAQLGDAGAERELAANARWERSRDVTSGRALGHKSGGGFATCGRCGGILPGDLHCRQCGHISTGDHHGSVRRHR